MEGNKVHLWTAKVKFINKSRDRKVPGSAKVYLQLPDKFRMDVYEPFGFVRIGSVVVNGKQAKADFINQDPYEGPATDEALKRIFKLDVSVQDVMGIFTQSGFSNKRWNCSVSESNTLSFCKGKKNQVEINWSGHMTSAGSSSVLNHPKAQVTFTVRSYEKHESANNKVFSL